VSLFVFYFGCAAIANVNNCKPARLPLGGSKVCVQYWKYHVRMLVPLSMQRS